MIAGNSGRVTNMKKHVIVEERKQTLIIVNEGELVAEIRW